MFYTVRFAVTALRMVQDTAVVFRYIIIWTTGSVQPYHTTDAQNTPPLCSVLGPWHYKIFRNKICNYTSFSTSRHFLAETVCVHFTFYSDIDRTNFCVASHLSQRRWLILLFRKSVFIHLPPQLRKNAINFFPYNRNLNSKTDSTIQCRKDELSARGAAELNCAQLVCSQNFRMTLAAKVTQLVISRTRKRIHGIQAA